MADTLTSLAFQFFEKMIAGTLTVPTSGGGGGVDPLKGGECTNAQLTNASAAFYTVSSTANTKSYVVVDFYNTNTTSETVTISSKPSGGTERIMHVFVLETLGSTRKEYGPLSEGDALFGMSTTNAKMNVTICRVERVAA